MPNILLPAAMNLCVLERLLSWNLTLSLTASEGGAFGRQSGNEGGALMYAINVFRKETQREPVYLFLHVRSEWKDSLCEYLNSAQHMEIVQ